MGDFNLAKRLTGRARENALLISDSSLSMRFSGIAAQLIATSRCARRGDSSWRARASNSLPVPDSPINVTVTSVDASRLTMRPISIMPGSAEMMPPSGSCSSLFLSRWFSSCKADIRNARSTIKAMSGRAGRSGREHWGRAVVIGRERPLCPIRPPRCSSRHKPRAGGKRVRGAARAIWCIARPKQP